MEVKYVAEQEPESAKFMVLVTVMLKPIWKSFHIVSAQVAETNWAIAR